jgi:hypothetical protein
MPIMLDKQWPRKADRGYTSTPLDILRSYYNKHTSAEGDRLVAPHIGKWFRTDGIVKDASILPIGDGQKNGCISLQEREMHIRTSLLFFLRNGPIELRCYAQASIFFSKEKSAGSITTQLR